MKLISLLALTLYFGFSVPAWCADEPIRFGVYKLKGTNPDGLKKYEGRIVVQKEGSLYRVTWFIGPERNQAQVGIGILNNGILSIGYMDSSLTDFGVVSLKVQNSKTLKGSWASIFSKGGHGEEEFIFESSQIPTDLSPKPVKAKEEST